MWLYKIIIIKIFLYNHNVMTISVKKSVNTESDVSWGVGITAS